MSSLETVEYTIIKHSGCRSALLTWPGTLKSLKIIYEDSRLLPQIQQSLTNLSELNNLEVYQSKPGYLFLSGATWEQAIFTSLPCLKNFKFYFQFIRERQQVHQVRSILASFSTPFFRTEKKCSVCCDISFYCEQPFHDFEYGPRNKEIRRVILYTIPLSFERFTIFKTVTALNNSHCYGYHVDYNRINTHKNTKTLIYKNSSEPDCTFTRNSITNLIIYGSFDALPWSSILTKLQHITIGECAALSSESFNVLLNSAPHINSLSAKKSTLKTLTDDWTDICICHHLSQKIRSLTFSECNDPSQGFDKTALEKILPIFGSQCQHLSLGVHSHKNTIDFIFSKMRHLISLHVYIQRKKYPTLNMEWLEKQNLQFNRTNCVITNVRRNTYFWLG